MDRRNFLKTAGAAGTIGISGLSGCLGVLGGGGEDADVRFVLTPAESDVNVKEQYAGVFDYLESETGASIEPKVAADHQAVLQALENDQADIADASPTLAVVGDNAGVTDVVGIRVAYGASRYFSTITTQPDSPIDSLSDLADETVVFGARLSTSGSLFPLKMLADAGLDVGDAPEGEVTGFTGKWSNDHNTAIEQLLERDEYMAAGTGAFVSLPHVPQSQLPEQVMNISSDADTAGTEDPELQLLAASDPIPRAPLLSRRSWEGSVRSDVQTALLDATESDLKGSNASDELWFTGVAEATIDDYEPVRNVKNTLGLEFGN
ncbi:phosphate/phosphite/phosphonate ABC transporter substrate-binding protein [Halobacterium salinarum]|uniref:phosphate/phosphite/phosphonate ABC transporter substrate-binding protein n=1 Tax=Halobacterium TaxID=2239 RepID=UPI001963A142|nr:MULTISPECIES: phosphate/phosphite/phosphonate ABC transporter substrate-binding protein [Halobacterium]MDL0136623.1 phosphate/phosphite/phosphonate ABC transporter substrate-binding protein [Halobacterium salinarum]MDL0139278.1 phosphate/phosphite/phosphonate ABC transporter substrate-binding protein [Halobacterium salinarum]QRY22290.1 phosphate/phosphite/phosphonate ABC transporter substrate-binding protein [Halobacterium sp. GSL-19]WJK63663.1 phosphate/phosphite/phosphonate ABC transporter